MSGVGFPVLVAAHTLKLQPTALEILNIFFNALFSQQSFLGIPFPGSLPACPAVIMPDALNTLEELQVD